MKKKKSWNYITLNKKYIFELNNEEYQINDGKALQKQWYYLTVNKKENWLVGLEKALF